MLNKLQSIPTVFKGVLLAFLTVMTIYVTYPITNLLLGLFQNNTMMKYAAVIAYWLVILFVTWVLLWVNVFNKKGGQ